MPLVAVKSKFQAVIPQNVREQQSLVNHGIAEGLADIEAGRVHGPYRSAADAQKAFQERTAKLTKRPKRKAS